MSSGVPSRLLERNEERKVALEQRRQEREAEQRKEEKASYFNQQFHTKKSDIVELIDAAGELAKEDLTSHFNHISEQMQALQKFVSDSSVFITSYDLRSCQKQIDQLTQQVSLKQDQLIPKKKFAFRSRKKDAQPSSQKGTDVKTEPSTTVSVAAAASDSSVGLRDKKNERLQLSAEEVKGHDVNLSGLIGCELRVYGAPSTLHMSKIDNCTILCGPVSSSVFVEDCKDSTLVVACQQLRVHNTLNTKFYLHVTSRAIIEDCSHVSFAPYSWTYPELESHFSVAGLDKNSNNWDKVDDFNWLASRDPSPNWSVLPVEDRSSFN